MRRGRFILFVVLLLSLAACEAGAQGPQALIEKIFNQVAPPHDAQLLYSDKFENNALTPGHGIGGLYGTNLNDSELNAYYQDLLAKQGWIIIGHMESGYPVYCKLEQKHVTFTMVNRAAYNYDPPVPKDIAAKAKTDYRTLFSVDVIYYNSDNPDCKRIRAIQ